MTPNNGGPAFPRAAGDFNGSRQGNAGDIGMTLRDYFAAKALVALITEPQWNNECTSTNGKLSRYLGDPADQYARSAYLIADAMLAAREGDKA